ncbi:phospholipase D-like domain-containing protein [Ileibacterium valens]|uniref:phospholipase D-like domain-containing protein n=1 Tax=Ileibacterium valens TaxID=1862668 RepID=UPI0024B9E062|nr:phospholipase D-like domain-containing protein [Ileibacterium valens]
MAQYIDSKENRITFGSDQQSCWLITPLKKSLAKASSIDFIVSFVMVSGVRLLIKDLKEGAKRNAQIRILCGNTLNITEPAALAMLYYELPENIEIRFYTENRRSFHPKSYLFRREDG